MRIYRFGLVRATGVGGEYYPMGIGFEEDTIPLDEARPPQVPQERTQRLHSCLPRCRRKSSAMPMLSSHIRRCRSELCHGGCKQVQDYLAAQDAGHGTTFEFETGRWTFRRSWRARRCRRRFFEDLMGEVLRSCRLSYTVMLISAASYLPHSISTEFSFYVRFPTPEVCFVEVVRLDDPQIS
jgi:hypothetical protein